MAYAESVSGLQEMDGNGIVALVLDCMSGGIVLNMMRYLGAPVAVPIMTLSASYTNPSNIIQWVVGLENMCVIVKQLSDS